MDDRSVPTISVIVPVHRNARPFHQCLSSLQNMAPAAGEVIVVADGDEESARVAATAGARVVQTPTTGGPARARNLGARHARGDILFFLDADVMVSRDAVTRLTALFTQEPHLAAVIGSYDDKPGEPNFLSQYRNLLHHYVHQNALEEGSTFWGACGAIRRDVFLEMGGFDEQYRLPSIEDIELGHRLIKAGYRIRLDKDLHVKHLKRWTAVSLVTTDFLHRALPWTEIILRDRHFVNDLNLRFSSRASVVGVYALLGALMAAILWEEALLIAGGMGVALLVLNLPVYRFFQQKCGFWFMVQVIPWHWLFYLYSGLAFALGVTRYLLCSWRRLLRSAEIT